MELMVKDKRIKVLETIRQGLVGGGESHLLSLVQHLDKSRFELTVLSFTHGPMVKKLEEWGIPVYVISTTSAFDVRVTNRVVKLIKELEIEIVHAHGTRAYTNVYWACRMLRIPVVYTVHGWSFHNDQTLLIRRIRILSEKFLVSRAARVILVSDSNRATGLKFFDFGNEVVIPNGIDLSRFNPLLVSGKLRSELPLRNDSVVISFIARFIDQKQPLLLLRAFAKAVKQDERLHLWMVGDGAEKEAALKLVDVLKIRDRVSFDTFRDDIPEILAASDVFVLPSQWEGLPIGLLEAMAMGKAVIGSNVDGTSEVISHMENGLLLDLEDLEHDLCNAMLMLCDSGELRARLGKQAIATVAAKFDIVSMGKKVEALYQDVIDTTQQQ
jgi:glycosyltransferase involved in cell wall biosynthesis